MLNTINVNQPPLVEGQRVEFKRQLTDGLEKEVVAFLNAHDGGLIYIGIDDDGQGLNLNKLDQLQLQIKDRIKQNISPSTMGLFDVLTERYQEKSIIKIVVARGSEQPYYLRKAGMSPKGCFIRIGSAAEPMPQRMIETLFATRTRNSIGNMRSRNQDLHFEQLKIYYQERDLPLNEQFARNLELLTTEGDFNYAAYLLADDNGMSIKVAKYSGLDRINLIENEEYGYCCLIKATKAVLEKLKVENKTLATITDSTRNETKLLNPIALREAVINAIIHNAYSRDVPPKFELFADRLEITSAGSLPQGFSQDEFFMGYSVPQNKELMRVFRDVDLVEQLGSGIPRILQSYSKDAFYFTDNFTRLVLPFSQTLAMNGQATGQATGQAETLLLYCVEPRTTKEMMAHLEVSHREHFRDSLLIPLLDSGQLEMTLPDKPRSPKQRYVTVKPTDDNHD
ncbi:RNA-binding domain-containing protein [Marinomonas sp. BSi20584]|uniref:RNA-binding domain-containing protein n=1 Tax=Marinomonas sp. BSi20584 TaxID=1594462 RepID=UPI000C1DCA20|nr:RNA-binding domain-containing protein [Marinomonas sp. BSi20584]PJE56354.1 transcriptional regulator [Marinomonas sp. BSi20584]